MGLKDDIKPITYLKNNTAEVIRDVNETGCKYVITQNGEAKAVVIGIDEYDRWRDSIALLKILRLSEERALAGRTVSQQEAFRRAEAAIQQVEDDAK